MSYTTMTYIFRMNLQQVIDRLRDEADMYTPLPSAFRTRRQSREDRIVEKVLRFIVRILTIIDNNSPLEDKIQEIIGCVNFLN